MVNACVSTDPSSRVTWMQIYNCLQLHAFPWLLPVYLLTHLHKLPVCKFTFVYMHFQATACVSTDPSSWVIWIQIYNCLLARYGYKIEPSTIWFLRFKLLMNGVHNSCHYISDFKVYFKIFEGLMHIIESALRKWNQLLSETVSTIEKINKY